ncbi:MAG: hypothetical protein DRP78_06105 [Candidatus Omnitrophota bacterium]|nr:MAG: hypothetical protein DRP78_06105 [Candidatus Omnitrophota bacterium]
MKNFLKLIFIGIITCVFVSGCVSTPKGFLKLPENYLEKRQIEMRIYDTKDEGTIISSVAGVLQDLAFTLDDSETKLGLVVASKKADASNVGQKTIAFFADVLSAVGGTASNNMGNCDDVQIVKASVIIKPTLKDGNRTVVRVTFQRIVWNVNKQISKVETLNDPEIYQKFFNGLSKAIFLEANEI